MSEQQVQQTQRIVVGIDGSEPSKAALRWAVRQAELTHGTVRALTVWDTFTGYGRVPYVEADEVEKAAHTTVTQTVEEIAGAQRLVPVQVETVRGDAAEVLVDESRHADLLVVGNRGHGRFASALLGSVSDRCAHHAKCPVVVVHRGE